MKYLVVAALVAGLAGCSPNAPPADPAPTPAAPAAEAPVAEAPADHSKPPEGFAESFPACTWTEVKGAGVAIWGYQCAGSKLVADPALPGITLEFDAGPKPAGEPGAGEPDIIHTPIVQLFDIAEGADFASILPAVRAASPAPGNEACAFEPSETSPGWLEFRPTGELKAKYQLFIDGKADEPVQPCGALGPSEVGARLFTRLPGSPGTKAAVVFLPSDIPSFDFKSIRASE